MVLGCGLLSAEGVDFHPVDKPTFEFTTNGYHDFRHFMASGILPIPFIEGYAGVKWIEDGIPEDETMRTHLRARLEGGKQWSWFGVRAYGRYGRESIMIEKGVWHGGFNVEFTPFSDKPIEARVGLGTWAEDRDILDEYIDDLPDHYDGLGLDFGPRVHFHLLNRYWSLQSELMFEFDWNYELRNFLHLDIPLRKVGFVDIGIVGTLGVHYESRTHHVSIDPLRWHWSHGVGINF